MSCFSLDENELFVNVGYRDDPYENIEVKYKMLQQKDDQVRYSFLFD